MSITIKISTGLKRFIANKKTAEVEANSIEQAIGLLAEQYPSFAKKALSSDGQLKEFIRVFVNAQAVDVYAQPAFSLSDGDEISLMTAIAGG